MCLPELPIKGQALRLFSGSEVIICLLLIWNFFFFFVVIVGYV